jgi:hypothetical protein
MPTHALLLQYPPESLDEIRHGGGTEVLATGTPAELESFLVDYQRRLCLACEEWDAWDDRSKDWDSSFDAMHDELCRRHGINIVISDLIFEIVEIGVQPAGLRSEP